MAQDIAAIEAQYTSFIEKVAATKLVWALKSKEGWANSHSGGNEEVGLIPFWSDRALAKACARDDWRSHSAVDIPLVDFLENWCTEMAENEILAGVNCDASLLGNETEALQLALDILNRLSAINSAIAFKNYDTITEFIVEINESIG